MARTFTAVYNPYSFDELVKPLAMYASEYRRQEDLMNKAYEEGVVEGTLAEGTKAYQIWEGINNNLKEVADELATNGMNPQLNKRINSVARDYRMKSKTLTQANTAYQQERQRRLNAMDSHVFQNNSSLSIDDFLDGKTPESKSVNLQNLTKEVGTEAAQLASALYSSPDWNNIKTRLGGQVYSIVTPNGAPVDLIEVSMYDDDAYNFVMANSTDEKFRENLSKFRDIYSNAMNRIDYTKYDSQDQLRLDEAIRLGMRAGMEQPKTETVSNKNFRTAQERLKDARDNAAWNFQWLTEKDENGNLQIVGENPVYTDYKMAQKGYYPKMDNGQRVTDPTTGQTVYEKVGTSSSSSGGKQEKQEEIMPKRVKITWNRHNEFEDSTVDNGNDITGKSITYEQLEDAIKDGKVPSGIIEELEYQGITADNAKYFVFKINDKDIQALRNDIKNVQGEEEEPLNYGGYTSPKEPKEEPIEH